MISARILSEIGIICLSRNTQVKHQPTGVYPVHFGGTRLLSVLGLLCDLWDGLALSYLFPCQTTNDKQLKSSAGNLKRSETTQLCLAAVLSIVEDVVTLLLSQTGDWDSKCLPQNRRCVMLNYWQVFESYCLHPCLPPYEPQAKIFEPFDYNLTSRRTQEKFCRSQYSLCSSAQETTVKEPRKKTAVCTSTCTSSENSFVNCVKLWVLNVHIPPIKFDD